MDITSFIVSRRNTAEILNNYALYRRTLSRRIHTVRKKLGRTTPRQAKVKSRPAITAEDVGGDRRYVELCLLNIERAWADAMFLKSKHAEDNAGRGPSGVARKQIISRLQKAMRSARQFVAVLSDQAHSGATDTDILEADAYAYTMVGLRELEQRTGDKRQGEKLDTPWKQCLQSYSAAHVIYKAIQKDGKNEAAQEMLSTVADPGVRYAAYQSRLPRTLSVGTLAVQNFPQSRKRLITRIEGIDTDALKDKAVAQRSKHSDNIPTTVQWRNRTAKIQDASVGLAIASVTSASAKLSKFLESSSSSTTAQEKAAAYDDVLLASQEAVDATRHAIEELEGEKVNESDPRMQDLRVTNLVVNYDLIGWRVGRNRILIGDDDGVTDTTVTQHREPSSVPQARTPKRSRRLTTFRDHIVLYDSILQSIDSVKDLPGASRDSDFLTELSGHRAYFQALKCLNIAYSHSLFGADPSRSRNALALVLRAQSLAASTSSSKDAAATTTTRTATKQQQQPPKLEITPAAAKTLQSTLAALSHYYAGLVTCQSAHESALAAAAAHKANQGAPPPPSTPLALNLDRYPAGGSVDLANLVGAEWPPTRLEVVPVKPLFFDVAFNYVRYPSEGQKGGAAAAAAVGKEESTSTTTTKTEKKGGGGWFGFGR